MSHVDQQQLAFKSRGDLVPDLCLYPKRGLSLPYDILKMSEMPLVAIEIISPKQGLQEILEKFAVYFAAGVRSCWLVDPLLQMVSIYPKLERHTIFSTGDLIDETVEVQLPVAEIFQ